jgi:proteasome accessory factor C
MKNKSPKETGDVPGKLLKLLQLISFLKASHWTIQQLMDRFGLKKSSMYRYLDTLEEAGFYIEKDDLNRYFIITTEDNPDHSHFTLEEMAMLRALVTSAGADHPLRDAVLKKVTMNSEIDVMPRMFLKAYISDLVSRLTEALRNKKQVILKNYHSANSKSISDRLVEPIHFGDNYGTIVALDVEDKGCKTFKLERVGEVIETKKPFAHEDCHVQRTTDMFGIGGTGEKPAIMITLHLTSRAYLLLREEFPLSIPYLKKENGKFIFHGPVAGFGGIGRFVMGLLDEVDIAGPEEFKDYVREKVRKFLSGAV